MSHPPKPLRELGVSCALLIRWSGADPNGVMRDVATAPPLGGEMGGTTCVSPPPDERCGRTRVRRTILRERRFLPFLCNNNGDDEKPHHTARSRDPGHHRPE